MGLVSATDYKLLVAPLMPPFYDLVFQKVSSPKREELLECTAEK